MENGEIAANGVGVIISSNGQLGTVLSSARLKEGIKPMYKASEIILALAFCADRAFGVCTNKHDGYRPKDKYSTDFWRANSSATGSVPHHV